VGESFQDLAGRGMFGGAAFRQDGQVLAPLAGHVLAHSSFDEAGHELGLIGIWFLARPLVLALRG